MRNILGGLLIAVVPVMAWMVLNGIDAHMLAVTRLLAPLFGGRVTEPELTMALDLWWRWRFVDAIALALFLPILFGGLPISLFAVTVDRAHRRWRVLSHSFYPCFVLQLVSLGLTAALLALMVPALFDDYIGPDPADLPMTAYLMAQFAAAVATVPTWRRIFEHAAAVRREAYFFR